MKSKNSTDAKVRFTALYDEQANASPYWPNVNRAGDTYNSDSLVAGWTGWTDLHVTALASVCLHDHTFIQPGPMLTD